MEVNDLESPEVFRKSASGNDDIRDAGLKTPDNIVRYDNICYGKDARWNVLDVYHLKEAEGPQPTIISVHGGGWVYGDKERYQYYCMDLAGRGFTVVNFTYRLAPEHIFPAALEDVNSVFVWVAEHAGQYCIDADRLFVVGDSAGGQLASQYLALLTDEDYRKLFDFAVPAGRLRVRGAGLNCGVYDTKQHALDRDDGLFLHYLNFEPKKYMEQIDTVSHVTSQFPPSFIMTSYHDFLYKHALPMYRLLLDRNVECRYRVYGGKDRPDIAHVFHLDPRLEEAEICNDEECAFFRSILEKDSHRQTALEIAREGIVLLENRGILPLADSQKTALFGSGIRHTVKGGTGSGDVNCRSVVNIEQGLKDLGAAIELPRWLDVYDETLSAAREDWKREIEAKEAAGTDFIDAYFGMPFRLPEENRVREEDIPEADTVVYAISRISGEGSDRQCTAGDFLLSESEYENLKCLGGAGKRIILVLNTGGVMDLSLLDGLTGIQAVVLLGQAGAESGTALAEVLLGRQTPCGKLTDTWGGDYSQYPSYDTYGSQNGDTEKEYFYEGIFVGYRWFDAFRKNVRYPFGYGLSYTFFARDTEQVLIDGGSCRVRVRVRNTGGYKGKDVVQIYMGAPEITGVIREEKKLVGFSKTGLLLPGEEALTEIDFPLSELARYDENEGAWTVDAGTYPLFAGGDVRDPVHVSDLEVQDSVVRKTVRVCSPSEEIREILPDGIRQTEPAGAQVMAVQVTEKDIAAAYERDARQRTERSAVGSEEEARASRICGMLSDDMKIRLVCGLVCSGSAAGSASLSVAGAAGETVAATDEKGETLLPSIVLADGPAGLRLSREYETDPEGRKYPVDIKSALEDGFFAAQERHEDGLVCRQDTTAFPVGTVAAQTWNESLLERFGRAVGEEMHCFGVHLWLAPGMNIHRNPLCGRNFEYFSEDPLLTGKMAAAITRGVQRLPGAGVTIKHFACNSQEDNRMGVDSVAGERALREIYLKGFETAIKEGRPAAIMTSYNRLNGCHTSNSRDLCTVAAREEWGFDGLIMTDWTTTANGSESWRCMAAGNDLIMPGSCQDHENIGKALAEGKLSMEELDACVTRIIRTVWRLTGAGDRKK